MARSAQPARRNSRAAQRARPRCASCRGCLKAARQRTPIKLMIENTDQRSKDYRDIAQRFHWYVITYHQKYGNRDYRGGGRSSARETASRVAAGGVARAVLAHLLPNLKISGYMVQMGPRGIDRARFDGSLIDQNPFFCPDAVAAEEWAVYLDELRLSHNSVGAVIEVTAEGVPAGLGAPLYAKLDTDLAAAMMSINAVKAVEIGDGMAAATLTGVENEDLGRYFGYDDGVNNYLKLPLNLTMQSNQPGEYTEITPFFLALIPIIFLFLAFKNPFWIIGIVTILGFESLYYFIPRGFNIFSLGFPFYIGIIGIIALVTFISVMILPERRKILTTIGY